MRIDNIQLETTFPHEYECRLLGELPGNLTPNYYPHEATTGRDGLMVLVSPQSGTRWLGVFAFGHTSRNAKTGLYTWPSSDRLCVVSSGNGYLVNVNAPEDYEILAVEPIFEVLLIEEQELAVFANYTELVAYGKAGLAWKSKRISWDGLKVTNVNSEFVEGQYWNPRDDANTSFRVRLADGTTEGAIDE